MRKALKAKVAKSIEQQMVSAASAGKLTIMKNTVPDSETEKTVKDGKR
jgi:hypothetical protein